MVARMAHLTITFVPRRFTPFTIVIITQSSAIGTWLPAFTGVMLVPLLAGLFGQKRRGVIFCFTGLLCGFAAYEILHYRIHFSSTLMPFERRLRDHHLVHRICAGRGCALVWSPALWDKVFGTEPAPEELAALYASVRNVQPLTGPSNLHRLVSSLLSSGRTPYPESRGLRTFNF